MSEISPADIIDTVTTLDRDASERIAWIIEQIAANGYDPGEPGQPWAGRIDITGKAMAEFQVSEPEAEQLVRNAQEDLWKGGDGGKHVRRRLMLARLNTIRTIIIEQMKQPRSMMIWQYVPRKQGKRIIRDANGLPVMIKVPKRESVQGGVDVQAIRLLLDLERTIAELTDLSDENGGDEVLARIFAQIDEDSQGNKTTSTSISVEQINKSSPAARAVLAKALEQHAKRKKVKSTDAAPGSGGGPDPATGPGDRG